MTDRNRVEAFNRRLVKIQEAADKLARLLAEECDPMFNRVESAAIEEVNDAFKMVRLPVRLKHL